MIDLPCLPLIQERFYNKIKDDERFKKYHPEITMYMFPQGWGDTSLGFGGIGGQAMTTAYTTVVCEEYAGYYGVFFHERLAYIIKNPNDKFFDDLHKMKMSDVAHSGSYRRREENNESKNNI